VSSRRGREREGGSKGEVVRIYIYLLSEAIRVIGLEDREFKLSSHGQAKNSIIMNGVVRKRKWKCK
jgi:hypothetical protein